MVIIAGSVLPYPNPHPPQYRDAITIQTKTVKKDGSTSTTDATSLVVIPSCIGFHDDPYRFGGDPVPCCYPLEKKLKDWDVDGTYRYQCEDPSDDCCTTGIGCTDDSNCCDQFGDRFECLLEDGCCVGDCTYPVGRQSCWPWVVPPPTPNYTNKDCCTTGIGCTELNDCCYKFGDPDDCTLDKYGLAQPGGICVGDCTFPVGREHIWPWYTVPTDTCVPVIGPFRGYSETTKHSLKLPFQTCLLPAVRDDESLLHRVVDRWFGELPAVFPKKPSRYRPLGSRDSHFS